MPRLSPDDYLRHIGSESARLRSALATTSPEARVPSCPDWSAADLLAHHGRVLWFWATIIERRPVGPDDLDESELPTAYDALLSFHEAQAARLVAALGGADPAAPAWSWSEEQTVGFTFRRQAHEALIHRLDAEQTAGSVTPLDPALAADGVDEVLDIMFGGTPAWGRFTGSGRGVRVDVADVGAVVWVETGRFVGTDPESGESHDIDDISVIGDPGVAPDAVVGGPAGALDAWLWRRGDDGPLTFGGDEEVLATFRSCVTQAIT